MLSPSGTGLLPANKSQLLWNQTQGSYRFLLFPFHSGSSPSLFPPWYFILCFILSFNCFTYWTSHYIKTQHFMEALPIALFLQQLHLLLIYRQTEILDALERIWLKETISLQTRYNSLHSSLFFHASPPLVLFSSLLFLLAYFNATSWQ